MTFKSRHEALDGWALKELVGADVAYRKLVSPSPSDLLPDDRFGLYAVSARFPHNLSAQVPWQQLKQGVYDCRWGTDAVRVLVVGGIATGGAQRAVAPVRRRAGVGRVRPWSYKRRSEQTSLLLGQLFEKLRGEGFAVSFTMEDFNRQYIKEHFAQLTPEEQQEVLKKLPPESRLAGLSAAQIRGYLSQLTSSKPARARESRRKK